jgi:transcriptional regulator with XRE-family HTH domain
MMAENNNIVENMMKMREALHWSRPDLAKETGITAAKLFRIEHGSRIYLDEAIQIAKAFGVTVDFMLNNHGAAEITSKIKLLKKN